MKTVSFSHIKFADLQKVVTIRQTTNPLTIRWFYGEQLTSLQWVGIVVITCGVIMLTLPSS